MGHPLTDVYRAEREQLLALGDSLSEQQGALTTSACPDWSIKDVYAHLAGISSNILSGDVEGAATVEWADGHVRDRLDKTLAEVLDEWRADGPGVSDVMEAAGEAFPLQLFIDQWTHGWDIRATLGEFAAAVPQMAAFEHYVQDLLDVMDKKEVDAPALTLRLPGHTAVIGRGEPIGDLEMDLFDYGRVCMGRRSLQQLRKMQWPEAVAHPEPYIDALVFWSVNPVDVLDPVLAGEPRPATS